MELRRVKISDIQVPEVRVTARFTPEIWEQFQASMRTTGQIAPIIVYETAQGLVLCDGLHRLIEAKNSGETEIYAAILPGDMADVLTKNIFLDHLRGRTPVSEMVSVIRYLWMELDLDSEKISERTGLSRDYVERLQKISELTPLCLEGLDEGKMGVGHAFALTRLTDPERQEVVYHQLVLYRWTVKELEGYIKEVMAILSQPPPEAPPGEVRPPVTVKCFYCKEELSPGQVANPNTCVPCSGALLASIAQAEREFREEKKQQKE